MSYQKNGKILWCDRWFSIFFWQSMFAYWIPELSTDTMPAYSIVLRKWYVDEGFEDMPHS
jgi:hypothetical protein